jgi:hypothetical protein
MISRELKALLILAFMTETMEAAKHIRHRHRCECGHSWEHTAAEAKNTPGAHTCICGRRVTKPEYDFLQQQGEQHGGTST